MNYLHHFSRTLFLLLPLLLILSCAGGEKVSRITTDEIPDSLAITTRDLVEAADIFADRLIASGRLGREGRPSRVYVHTPRNNTRVRMDQTQMINRLRTRLIDAGLVEFEVVRDYRGLPEDPQAAREMGLAQRLSDREAPELDYALQTTFSEQYQRDDLKSRTVTYTINMQLSDIRTGGGVWQGTHTINKQGKRGRFGW